MSSRSPLPVPRTGVPLGIDDPVEKARAELKAALAAIEVKANVPRRLSESTERTVAAGRAFARRSPGVATGARSAERRDLMSIRQASLVEIRPLDFASLCSGRRKRGEKPTRRRPPACVG